MPQRVVSGYMHSEQTRAGVRVLRVPDAPPVVTDVYKEAEQRKFVRLLVNSSCFTFDEKIAVKVADIFVREERAFESVMDMVQIAK